MLHSCSTVDGWRILIVALVLSSATLPALAEAVDADVVLVGATVYDGSGKPGVVGDIALRDDRIVAVGRFETGHVGKTIDCSGLAIAPGFIDLHNHSDGAVDSGDGSESLPRIVAEKTRPSMCYLTQGCTTIVTGNCGGGAVDVGKFYDQIDTAPPGVNVAHLLPQGAVRERVIGATRREPSESELAAMQELTRAAMQQGAWGMSTGLQYVPSAYAGTQEIAAMARVVAEFNGIYASHIRNEGPTLVEAVEEAIEIGRLARVAVHVSHFKATQRPNWGKVRLAAASIEQARRDGLRVTADQYPYTASSTSIAAMLLPDREREGSRADLTARLNDAGQLARLRPMIEEELRNRGRVMVAECPAHPEWVGKTIGEIARAENRDPVDVALDVIRTGDEQGVSFSMDERDVRWVMTLPWVATASDGSTKVRDGTKPHPRSFGTFPRRIGRYAVEEAVIPLELAIRSATGLPADILGLPDRGYLRPGAFADVVVFDPEALRDRATFQSPFEVSTGVRWLFVNGETAIADGELREQAAGRALRKSAG